MKKVYVGLMAIGAVVGPFAAESVTHAEDVKRIEIAERQTQGDDEVVWAAWRNDFWAMLLADEEYHTAEAAVRTHEGDDKAEYARLEAVANVRFREIARVVYEEYFDVWKGDDAEFDELIGRQAEETHQQKLIAVCKSIQTRCEDLPAEDAMPWCTLWFEHCVGVGVGA